MNKHVEYSYRQYFKRTPLAVIEQNRNSCDNIIHTHHFHELVIVASGSASHIIAGREHEISAGDVFVINPGMEHGYRGFNNCCYYDVLYDDQRLKIDREDIRDIPGYETFFIKEPQIRREQGIPPTLKLTKYELKVSCDYLSSIIKELREEEKGFSYSSIALLMSLIVHISRCYEGGGCKNEQLLTTINFIKTNLAEDINLEILARISNMSRSSFVRKFREFMGCSPMDYVVSCRINQACEMLAGNIKNISSVAAACGFNDSNYFSRCFKKYIGFSPRDYYSRKYKDNHVAVAE